MNSSGSDVAFAPIQTSPYLADFVVGHPNHLPQHVVCFTDELHVAVLDPVVNHLHEVTGALVSYLFVNKNSCPLMLYFNL